MNESLGRASVLLTLWRGLRLRCPACGEGRLFRGYLKLSAACPRCGADFGRAETADVAPYVTVFVVGVLVMPTTAVFAFDHQGDWLLPLSLFLAVGLTLALLPRVKGALAALLWRAQREM